MVKKLSRYRTPMQIKVCTCHAYYCRPEVKFHLRDQLFTWKWKTGNNEKRNYYFRYLLWFPLIINSSYWQTVVSNTLVRLADYCYSFFQFLAEASCQNLFLTHIKNILFCIHSWVWFPVCMWCIISEIYVSNLCNFEF